MAKPFIEELVRTMTLEEKLAQMTQLTPAFLQEEAENDAEITGPMQEMNLGPEKIAGIGSTLNVLSAELTKSMQKLNMERNPHKIPLMFMADIIHGFKTIFPIPLACACSFNPTLYKEACEVAARESAVSGIQLTFSPMADLARDPRWGRIMESFGEDPYLNARMTEAAVNGYQGEHPGKSGKIAACVKHFAGYGAAEGGRDYNTADFSFGTLREYFLPGYKAGIDAGARMVMSSFNVVDRIPAGANRSLMRDMLRDEWGFDGVVISDFNAVGETITHGYAKDGKEAAARCLDAGMDIEMMSSHFLNHGKELVESGIISESLLDEAVTRILTLKDELGLFENPYGEADPEKEKQIHLCSEHLQASRSMARESVVLLKNEGVLPLKKGLKIGLCGPFATSKCVLGAWTFGKRDAGVSLYDGLASKLPEESITVAMEEELGSELEGVFDVPDHVQEACARLSDCDVLIAAVGESQQDVGEAASKSCLRLSPNQEKLIWELKKSGKPVIVVVFSGRPMEVRPILGSADALVQAWFLGTESGNALADILLGDYNPSGRLAVSIPQTVGQIPIHYNHYSTGRPSAHNGEKYVSRYLDCPDHPLFCFGYGLSYSRFVYRNLEALSGEPATVSVTVENDSERSGVETVQLYIHDVAAGTVRPVKELKGFQKIALNPHEKATVSFSVTHEMLSYWNNDCKLVFEPGEFDLMVGGNSEDVLTQRIHIG